MSDLQCPATFYVLGPGTDAGSEVPLPVGRDDARIAVVRCAPTREALGQRLAEALDCGLLLEESLAGDVLSALADFSDLHRGESLVVLPAEGYPGRPDDRWLSVRVDADGTAVSVLP